MQEFRENINGRPVRFYDDGCCVRVDVDDTGDSWPEVAHPGFAWLVKWKAGGALEAARQWVSEKLGTPRKRDAVPIVLVGQGEYAREWPGPGSKLDEVAK